MDMTNADRIEAAGLAGLAATGCTSPSLMIHHIVPRLAVAPDGKILGIGEDGLFRYGRHGFPMSPTAVALELAADPDFAVCWQRGVQNV
jgi:hypothetical protein